MWYTFDVTEQGLERLQTYWPGALRVWQYLEYSGGEWHDHFVTVIDCEPEQALWLYLL